MNKRNWLLALSLSLAFSPCYADWAKLKAAASDSGSGSERDQQGGVAGCQ